MLLCDLSSRLRRKDRPGLTTFDSISIFIFRLDVLHVICHGYDSLFNGLHTGFNKISILLVLSPRLLSYQPNINMYLIILCRYDTKIYSRSCLWVARRACHSEPSRRCDAKEDRRTGRPDTPRLRPTADSYLGVSWIHRPCMGV